MPDFDTATARLVADLRPELHPDVYAFALLPATADVGTLAPLAMFREAEGLTVVLVDEAARAAQLSVRFRAERITLRLDSDLEAVGLTAAFSAALAAAGIGCNVIAAVHHDHVFVPAGQGGAALEVLLGLQAEAQRMLAAD